MNKLTTKSVLLILTLLIIVILSAPVMAAAASQRVEPRSSDYLDYYYAEINPAASGDLEVNFNVGGKGIMDEIGARTIILQESTNGSNWYIAETFRYGDYPNMMGYDKSSHSSYVEYAGDPDRFYRAYVTVWAGKNGGGDSRRILTDEV